MKKLIILVFLSMFFVRCEKKDVQSSPLGNELNGVWLLDSVKVSGINLILPNLDKDTKFDGSTYMVNFKEGNNLSVDYSTENFNCNYHVFENDSVVISNIDFLEVGQSESKYFEFISDYLAKAKSFDVSSNLLELTIENHGSEYIMFFRK